MSRRLDRLAASVAAPKVLLLPGASGSATFWHPVGARLPDHWEKVYLSWPGLGAEPPSPAVGGFADCVRLVERHLDRPYDLVAQSMGGIVAVQVAARNPGLVRRLVLCVTSGGVDVTALGAVDWRADHHADHPAAARWISDEHPDVSAEMGSLQLATLLLWGGWRARHAVCNRRPHDQEVTAVILRTWRTSIDQARASEYLEFALTKSLPMFREQSGLLGVFLAARGDERLVVTLWESHEAVMALETSETYTATVAAIEHAGFLQGEATVELCDLEGGFVNDDMFTTA